MSIVPSSNFMRPMTHNLHREARHELRADPLHVGHVPEMFSHNRPKSISAVEVGVRDVTRHTHQRRSNLRQTTARRRPDNPITSQ